MWTRWRCQQKIEYEVAARTAPHFFITLLYDDCIERGKPLLSGGVRYQGGTLETYGNVNTSDSMAAIRKMVYEEKRFSLEQLREMLLHNFSGYERERRMLLSCPKYGNDDGAADEMAIRVHEHICKYVRGCAEKAGLDSYLVVIINNSANTAFGRLHRRVRGRQALRRADGQRQQPRGRHGPERASRRCSIRWSNSTTPCTPARCRT